MESCVSLGESELNRPISGPQQVGFAARIVCEDNFLTSLGLKEGRRVSSVFNAGYPQKWGRYSGIVMLLPHGYEGQGPEHSSAKIERYLQLCAQDNLQVANVTTPAQLFHLFRRQVLRQVRKPLIVMTPKSLLRHPLATSTLDDLCQGRFQRVIGELEPLDTGAVKRVVLCSGKIYYELVTRRRELEQHQIALVRVELLHPYPQAALDEVLQVFPEGVELVWCQEEPRNMGAWPSYLHWMLEHFGPNRLPRYIGRMAAASPATGSNKKHRKEQASLLDAALTL
jgi:2-oxoglutarate dehydrogenase E1 component